MFVSNGTVSSNIEIVLFFRDTTTKSGLSDVAKMSGGMVQGRPPASQKISIFSFSEIKLAMRCRVLSCRQVYRPWSRATGQPAKAWDMVSRFPHLSQDCEMTFPHLERLSFVGSVFSIEFSRNLATPRGKL